MLWSTIFGGKFRAKNARAKVLAEHLLFLLRPVIHYWTSKINKLGGGGFLLSSGVGKISKIYISGGGGGRLFST